MVDGANKQQTALQKTGDQFLFSNMRTSFATIQDSTGHCQLSITCEGFSKNIFNSLVEVSLCLIQTQIFSSLIDYFSYPSPPSLATIPFFVLLYLQNNRLLLTSPVFHFSRLHACLSGMPFLSSCPAPGHFNL